MLPFLKALQYETSNAFSLKKFKKLDVVVTSSQNCLPFIVFCGTRNRSDIGERMQCSPNTRNLLVYKLLLSYVYFFYNQPVIMPTDQSIYNTQHLFPCHQFYFITLLTIAKEIRFLKASPTIQILWLSHLNTLLTILKSQASHMLS